MLKSTMLTGAFKPREKTILAARFDDEESSSDSDEGFPTDRTQPVSEMHRVRKLDSLFS